MSLSSEATVSPLDHVTRAPMLRGPPVIPPRARGRPPPPPAASSESRRESGTVALVEGSPRKLSPRRASLTAQHQSSNAASTATTSHEGTRQSNQDNTSSPPLNSGNVPLPTRNSSSVSSLSGSSSRHLPSANERDTSSIISTNDTSGSALGTPEHTSPASRLDVTDNLETFGQKMSYALQVDAPLLQGLVSPTTADSPAFSSPTIGAGSRRGSRNDDRTYASDSVSRWTPPGRISRPSGVSPSSPRQHSPESAEQPRLQSSNSYLTKRQQQTHDLRSEVDEENRKRRERRTVTVKDGYKIVDGVRAKASSSGVYTPTTFSAVPSTGRSPSGSSVYTPATLSPSSTPGVSTPNGFGGFPGATSPGIAPTTARNRASLPSPGGMLSPSLSFMSFTSAQSSEPPGSAGGNKSRQIFPSALSRKKSSGLISGDHNPTRLVGSAITGMRSLSMGIEHWRKHSVLSTHGAPSPAASTEYDELLRREEMNAAPSHPASRNSITEVRYERQASLSAINLPEPRVPRRQSEPTEKHSRSGFVVSSEDQAGGPAVPSTMGGKNVKGLRLPLSDMRAFSAIPSQLNASPVLNTSDDTNSPSTQIPIVESTVPGPSLLSPAIISATTGDPMSAAPSPTPSAPAPTTTPPISMGEATKGTRRKPVPSAFATKIRTDSPAATGVSPSRRASDILASGTG